VADQQCAISVHHLEVGDPIALGLNATHDLTHKSTGDPIGLHQDEGTFGSF
jgi:hypothetical protein